MLQIACGQQHSMCRVVNRSDYSNSNPDSSLPGDVYVWGKNKKYCAIDDLKKYYIIYFNIFLGKIK